MHNFVFHNPTKVLFGKDTIPAIGRETARLGNRVLLVHGCGSIRRNGIYRQVIDSLQAAGTEIFEWSGVQANPLLSHVEDGIQFARQHQVEVICAVGGGSVIDSAKAIGAGVLANHSVWKFFTGKKSVRQTLPLTSVVTLAAAGSEMNSGMVLTNDDTKQKFGFAHRLLYPKTSIIDPKTTYTVPAHYTAFGAIDALAHLLELYFTTEEKSTPVQDRFMEGLAINIIEACNTAVRAPKDYTARAALLWSAALALNGLASAGLGKVGFPMHLIEHALSALYNVPHGAGLAVIIPGWLSFQANKISSRLEQFFQRTSMAFDQSCTSIEQGIATLTNWFSSIGAPTSLEELNISAHDIPMIASHVLPQAKVWRMKEYESQELIERILIHCSADGCKEENR